MKKAEEADDASDAAAHNLRDDANAAASGGRRQCRIRLEHHVETPQDAIRPARNVNGVKLGDYETMMEAAAHNLGGECKRRSSSIKRKVRDKRRLNEVAENEN